MTLSEQYSPARSTAIHEAGHAVMAYMLGRPFIRINVMADGSGLGSISHAPPGERFRPDIEINTRARRLAEDHVTIILAGPETEEHWARLATGAPEHRSRAQPSLFRSSMTSATKRRSPARA